VEFGLGCHLHFSWRGVLIHNIVTTWSARSLSASRSADTSATRLMTTFQILSHSGRTCISASSRSRVCTVRPWGAMRQAFWRLALLCRDSRWLVLLSGKSILKQKQKFVCSRFILRHQPDLPPPYCSGATPQVCLTTPPSSTINLLETHFHHLSAQPPFGQQRDLPRRHDDLP
jgi:hypothetical protein